MIFKKLCRFAAAAVSAIFAASIMCFSVFAVGDTCELNIPFSISDRAGTIPKSTVIKVEISSKTSALPEKTVLEAEPSGEYNFGPIVFDEPGDYEYTIREISCSDSRIELDKTVYIVHAVALYNDNGKLVSAFSISKKGSAVKPMGVVFENKSVNPEPEPSSILESSSIPDPSSEPDSSSQKQPDHSSSSDPRDSSVPEIKPQTGAKLSYIFPALLLPILAVIAIVGRRSDKEKTDCGSPPDDRTG